MPKRKKLPSKQNPLELIRQLHEQLKQCDRLPPPWDAYQTDNPIGHHNLLGRLVDGLRIPGLGPARHIVFRGDPPQRQEFFPDRFWAIEVMPSFSNRGLFAVFESRSLIRCAFVCKGDMPDKPDADYVIVDQFIEPHLWDDPVLKLLNAGSLAPTPDRTMQEGMFMATADGIGYRLHVQTNEISALLSFSNPNRGHYGALEKAAFRAADQVSSAIARPQVSSFMNTWKNYI